MTLSKTIIRLFSHTICFRLLQLIFEINSRNVKINKTLKFVQYDETAVLDIRGLIYYGDFHFTCCIVRNDGISTGSACENEDDIEKFESKNFRDAEGNNWY
jgi:hypothetical protein